ncbi:MAG: hypothetical protein IJ071_10630 [Ruminococcus sp.]|nr:hypothetical protein [Ruminococcus sp.]
MNIDPFEAKVISSAVDYFIKQKINGVPDFQKEKLDAFAIEAKALIASESPEINASHIQALYGAIEIYIQDMKKSVLSNPDTLSVAKKLSERFHYLLDPLNGSY